MKLDTIIIQFLLFSFFPVILQNIPNVTFFFNQAEDILNKRSGWKVLTGTADFRKIVQEANFDDPDSPPNKYRVAFEMFGDRILNYVGSYFLKLKGFLWEQGVRGPADSANSLKVYPAREPLSACHTVLC